MARYPSYTGQEPCREMDPDLFFPNHFVSFPPKTRAVLDEICSGCPAQPTCLMWAIHHERDGYWAGTTPADRERLRKQMGITLEIPVLPLADRRGEWAA
jgi:hypothetical protein